MKSVVFLGDRFSIPERRLVLCRRDVGHRCAPKGAAAAGCADQYAILGVAIR